MANPQRRIETIPEARTGKQTVKGAREKAGLAKATELPRIGGIQRQETATSRLRLIKTGQYLLIDLSTPSQPERPLSIEE